MKSMRDYVLMEESINHHLLDQYDTYPYPEIDLSQYAGIILYATGSSANASYCAKIFMSSILGLPVFIAEPSLAKTYEQQWSDKFLYIAISQGGHSASIVELVDTLQQSNHLVWAITSDEDSPLAKISQQLLLIDMPKEEMPYVTAGYTATIIFLWLLTLKLAKINQLLTSEIEANWLEEICQVIKKAPEAIAHSDKWFSQFENALVTAKRYIFIGYGSAYGVAREGETKFTETVHMPSHGFEVEEYMHGPYLGLNQDDFVIMLETEGKLTDRLTSLRQFLDLHLQETYCISVNMNTSRPQDVMLANGVHEYLSPILLTIPIHLISYHLSTIKGFDLTQSFYPEFDNITRSKI